MATKELETSEATLDALEHDIRTLLEDSRSGGDAQQLIGEVVADSDFVPQDELSAVGVEMLDRIQGGKRSR